jgi:phosphate transport system permease protein
VLAVPVSVLIALYLTEIAPPLLATPLGYLVDLLAAVPSVVYGLWRVFVLVPFLAPVWQWLSDHLGARPRFHPLGDDQAGGAPAPGPAW